MQLETPAIRHPTGESYPIGTLRDMAAIPNNFGQRDQFLRELQHMLQQVAEMYATIDALIEENVPNIRAQLPWYLRWVPDRAIRKWLADKAFAEPPTFVDEGKDQGTMIVRYTVGDEEVRRSIVTHAYPGSPGC